MVKGCRVKLRLGKDREPGALEINTGSGGTGCDGAGSRALRDSLGEDADPQFVVGGGDRGVARRGQVALIVDQGGDGLRGEVAAKKRKRQKS